MKHTDPQVTTKGKRRAAGNFGNPGTVNTGEKHAENEESLSAHGP